MSPTKGLFPVTGLRRKGTFWRSCHYYSGSDKTKDLKVEGSRSDQGFSNSSLRNTPSTAGTSMTGSDRPSPEPRLWKKKRPQPYWGGDNSGNALEASNALNYRVWGIPAVLSTGIPGNALRAFPGSFRNFSGISSGKCQPYREGGPKAILVFGDIELKMLQMLWS